MSEALNIAGDVEKALQLLPIITSTIASAQSTMTADQHVSAVQKTLDLLNVAGTSAVAVANSGTVGTADAQHIKDAVAAVDSSAGFWESIAAFIGGLKKAFGWL